MNSIAVIADIHGNVWALESILEDIYRRGINSMINLGDHHVYGPIAPAATLERLLCESIINISGNEDCCLFLPSEQSGSFSSYAFTCSRLNAEQLRGSKL